MRSLKIRRAVASHWRLTRTNQEDLQTDFLTTTREVGEEFNTEHSMVIQHLKQIGKVKKAQ